MSTCSGGVALSCEYCVCECCCDTCEAAAQRSADACATRVTTWKVVRPATEGRRRSSELRDAHGKQKRRDARERSNNSTVRMYSQRVVRLTDLILRVGSGEKMQVRLRRRPRTNLHHMHTMHTSERVLHSSWLSARASCVPAACLTAGMLSAIGMLASSPPPTRRGTCPAAQLPRSALGTAVHRCRRS